MSRIASLVVAGVSWPILVSAAGAADLPSRKAEPVDYVRTCALGAFSGFVIPGTDVCFKLGGFVRYQYTWNQVQHGFRYVPGVGGYNSVTGFGLTNGNGQRADAALIMDARTQTDYGLLRSYADLRVRQQSPTLGGATSIIVDKAYVQFGPWSFGVFQSFFDFYTDDFNNIGALASDADIPGIAYTAKLGDAFFATFALEDRGNLNTVNAVPIPDVNAVWATAGAQVGVSTTPFNLISPNAGYRVPDAVVQFLYDPGSTGWGKAQLSGALHQARTGYATPPFPGSDLGDTQYGWAVQGGLKFNLPMLAPGDTAFIQAAYEQGASNYLQASTNPNGLGTTQVTNAVFLSDAVAIGPASKVKLSSGWNALVAFDHYWTPSFDTAIWVNYTSINMPGGPLSGTVLPAGFAYGSAFAADFRYWQVGAQASWYPVKGLKFAGTLNFVSLERSSATQDYLFGAGGAVVSVARKDIGSLAGALRIQRDF
jgi:hypothetical protein